MGLMTGLALCGVITGSDYGSTLAFQRAAQQRGFEINEVGPVASHGLALGAGVKGALCLGGEVLLRKHPKQRRVFRVVGVLAAGALVGSHMWQKRELERKGGR